MIFATVGTQLPFPRLMEYLEEIGSDVGEPIVAQTCDADRRYANIESHAHLAPEEYSQMFRNASCVVAHAGIGTILTARKLAKPLILVPRRAALGEHRNDHQLATARQLATRLGLKIANSSEELRAAICNRAASPPIVRDASVFVCAVREMLRELHPAAESLGTPEAKP